MPWLQNYDPLHGPLSTVAAALPLVVLLGLLASRKVPAHVAALSGLAAALMVAIGVIGMPPALGARAALLGAAYGMLPIGWIVLNVIFLYRISEERGVFVALQRAIAGITADRRLQLLLIAFAFGAFFEGAAGFGTPVAVTGAMLIGLGFPPLEASALSLIANTAPVAFGALGTPVIALQGVTGLDLGSLSAMIGRQLPFFSVIVPFWLIAAYAGFRGHARGLAGAARRRAVVRHPAVSRVELPRPVARRHRRLGVLDAGAGDFPALLATRAIRAGRRGRRTSRDGRWACGAAAPRGAHSVDRSRNRRVRVGYAAGQEFSQSHFLTEHSDRRPRQDGARVPPVVAKATNEPAVFALNWLSATGTAILLAAIIAGFALRYSVTDLIRRYVTTFRVVWRSLLTIAAMLALGYTTRYSGEDAILGLAFAHTGAAYPFFAAMLGWLGVALTGSDTSSNVLFGSLQKITATRLSLDPVLMAAANSSGGVMGKMIDAQSIVVASTTTGWTGHEWRILRFVFFHSLALASLVGILVLLQQYVFTGMLVR